MPNGYQESRDAVWAKSKLWGVVWQIGDTAYYVGLLLSIIWPFVFAMLAALNFRGWQHFFASLWVAVVGLCGWLPAGMVVAWFLKRLAHRKTGTTEH